MAFSENREYQHGDEIRTIDWNVTARMGTHVKVFEEERELTVFLLLDVSGSNATGTRKQTKRDLITELSAVLAFSAMGNNDKVGAVLFSNRIERFIPPKKAAPTSCASFGKSSKWNPRAKAPTSIRHSNISSPP